MEVHIRAPAKINLGLEILGRRADGFHEIRTLFQALSLFDRILIRPRRRGIRLACPGVECAPEENLAWRAAESVLSSKGARGGIDISITKSIPAGGGLGGGSSDAAAVLLGGCLLLGLKPLREDLAGRAASLGSDVPFFLFSGAAVGRGRGEFVEPLQAEPPPVTVLLFDPGFPVSTAAVYGECRPRLTRGGRALTILLERWKEGDPAGLGKAIYNDLEEPVLRRHPLLGEAKSMLRAAGAEGAQVTGSGACLFGIFSGPGAARKAALSLRRRLPGTWRIARFLPPRRRW